jgi:hypothetical protein
MGACTLHSTVNIPTPAIVASQATVNQCLSLPQCQLSMAGAFWCQSLSHALCQPLISHFVNNNQINTTITTTKCQRHYHYSLNFNGNFIIVIKLGNNNNKNNKGQLVVAAAGGVKVQISLPQVDKHSHHQDHHHHQNNNNSAPWHCKVS